MLALCFPTPKISMMRAPCRLRALLQNYYRGSGIPQIDPTGKSLRFIGTKSQASFRKIFLFSRNKNRVISLASRPTQGALRNVPMRGGDAVDADGASDESG
jgi:hypothetical protein